MPIKRMILIFAAVAACGVLIVVAYYVEHRKASATLTRSEWQIQQALNQESKDPKFRAMHAVHQRFQDLFESMPAFDQANFGSNTETVFWRSDKWTIQSVYDAPDGSQFVELGYAQGPGTDQEHIAQLVNGHYVGRPKLDWNVLIRDPRRNRSVVTANELPFVCRDVRSGSSQYAAIPSADGGPNVTKTELADASMGASNLPGVALACYRFADLNLVELVAGTGVLFKVDGRRLIPLVRGYIAYADAGGSFMIVQVDAGYDDKTDWPVNDYLEVFALRH
jgi:hypothetical protein